MILNNKIESPYNKFPPEGPVPIISKSIVKSKLSNKFSEINEIDIKSNFEKFKANNNQDDGNISGFKPENNSNASNNYQFNEQENTGYITKNNNQVNTYKSNTGTLKNNRTQSTKPFEKRNDNSK